MKALIGMFLVLGFAGAGAHADDGEGLAAPRKGSCERVAYDAADAQFAKDDGNNAYHLAGITIVNGGPTYESMSVEVDFDSAEDGAYSYQVDMKVLNPASNKSHCVDPKVKSLNK